MSKLTLDYILNNECRQKIKEMLSKHDDDGSNLYGLSINRDGDRIYYTATMQNRHTVTTFHTIDMPNTLKVKLLTETAIAPTKAHETDLGYDIYADEDVSFSDKNLRIVKTGIALGFPKGFGGIIKDRSSMASKGFAVHGGVIDEAYIGEISVVISHDDPTQKIEKGDKIAQIVLTRVHDFPIMEVAELDPTDRGSKGFGSSGKK